MSYEGSLKRVRVDEQFLQGFFSDWRNGAYDAAFAELSQAARVHENQDLKTVAAEVADLQRKGEHAVEIFGLKIASDDINRWGMVILLIVQFYLWMQIHQLPAELERGDAGREVPWFALYRSPLAALATVVSLGILPVVTVSLLCYQIGSGAWPIWAKTAALGFGLPVTIAAAFLCVHKLGRVRKSLAAADDSAARPAGA